MLRALKDLENERAIGKIEPDDYEQISNVYRNDLKVVLQLIDDAIAPLRPEAERVVHAHLVKAGLVGYAGDRGVTAEDAASEAETPVMPRTVSATAPVAPVAPVALGVPSAETRKECPTCQARNEPDAKFCKECATKLVATAPATHPKTEIAEAEDV